LTGRENKGGFQDNRLIHDPEQLKKLQSRQKAVINLVSLIPHILSIFIDVNFFDILP
jgi:hypothetical protein